MQQAISFGKVRIYIDELCWILVDQIKIGSIRQIKLYYCPRNYNVTAHFIASKKKILISFGENFMANGIEKAISYCRIF